MKWLSLVFTALYWCYCCLLFAGAFAASCRFSPPLLWLVHLPPVATSTHRCCDWYICRELSLQSAVAMAGAAVSPGSLLWPLAASAATLLLAAASLSCSPLLWAVYCGLCICRELSLQSAVAMAGAAVSPGSLLWPLAASAATLLLAAASLSCSLLPH